jgi:hypothetical protein
MNRSFAIVESQSYELLNKYAIIFNNTLTICNDSNTIIFKYFFIFADNK